MATPKFQLKPLREWCEKDGKKVTDDIRLYMGNIHLGTCRLSKKNEENYWFSSMFDFIQLDTRARPLEDIKIDLELTLKEFISTLIQ